MKRLILLLVLVLAPFSVFADDEAIGDKVILVDEENVIMNKAIDDARATLDDFLALYKNPPKGAEDFKLKVMLSDDNGDEHFWFIPFKEIDGGFAGVLANEPQIVKSVEFGEVYAFRREQITDWGYVKDGVQYGSYTICALFHFMEKEIVERYKKDHGFVCEP